MVRDIDRVQAWLSAGTLLPPSGAANTVSLSRAVAALCGGPTPPDEDTDRLAGLIGEAERYVLVLVDGLGMNLIESLPPQSFLRSQVAMELRAVFPSSTAPALTSLFTGRWPGLHGVPAWFTYLPQAGRTAAILPFVDRLTRRPMKLESEVAFFAPSIFAGLGRRTEWLVPQPIVDSVYTRYASGGSPTDGYASIEEAMEVVAARATDSGAGLTYLYHPEVDTAEHDTGVESPQTAAEIARIDRLLGELARQVAGRARLIVTADHGQVTVGPQSRYFLAEDDPLQQHLRVWPPAGEPRVPFFHVLPGGQTAFETAFRARFGEAFALLSTAEAEMLRLFGPEPFDEWTRARVGDYICLSAGRDVLIYRPETGIERMVGFHGGLLPDEMRVPLILA